MWFSARAVNANGKPSAASPRAEPASQGFGITNGSPACSARNAAPLSSVVRDTQHHLAALAALRDTRERGARLLEWEDRVDRGPQLAGVREARELDELLTARPDHEVRRAVSLLGDRDDARDGPNGTYKRIAADGIEDDLARLIRSGQLPAREL